MKKNETPAAVRQWFKRMTKQLWPIATGSLALRKGPCIRERCPACASGEGHSSYALYGRSGKKRFSIYVPERLVPEVRAAIRNGRRLQELINEAGVRYVKALKSEDRPQLGK
jgi:hypothetical protein